MSKFDRSAFKPTKTKDLHKQDEIAQQARPSTNYASILTLDDGVNRIRIAPAHPGTSEFIQANNSSWLPKEVNDKDTNQKVWKKGPVFNARTHGGQEKDIVEEYINFVKSLITNAHQDGDQKLEEHLKDALKKLTTFYKGNDFYILPSLRWSMYCWKIKGDKKEFGELLITDGLRKKINNIATSDDDEDDVMSVDPFTDPDTGRCVLIKKEEVLKGNSKQTEYNASIDIKKETPLTEEDLEILMKYEPLEKRFKNSYTRKDFELAINGLKRIDQQLKIDVFEYDEFLDLCEELHDKLPDHSTSGDEGDDINSGDEVKSAPAPKPQASTPKKEESSTKKSDQDNDPDGLAFLEEMDRDALIEYIDENNLPVLVKRNDTEDDIRKKLKVQLTGITNELPFDKDGNETGLGKARKEVSERAATFKKNLLGSAN